MKKLIFLLCPMCLMWLTSCLTTDRIHRNCYKFAQICVTSSTTETTSRDTTIHFPPIAARLPESNILIQTELKIIDGKINLPLQVVKNGLITTEVEIIDNQLHVRSFLNDSTILVQPDPVTIHDAIREEKSKQTITLPPEKHVPGFYKFTLRYFVVSLVVGLLYLLWVLYFRRLRKFFPKE